MAKTFQGKLEHGRVHDWRREDAGRTAISVCGIVVPREFVTTKGFQWPRCQRCERSKARASTPEVKCP